MAKLDLIRARFRTSCEDYRPAVWPIPHPYWCTGYAANGDPIIVAYVDSVDQLKQQWPEAYDIDDEHADAYQFTDRFPKPTWFTEENSDG